MPKKHSTPSLPSALVTALTTQARENNRTMRLVCRLLVSLVLAAMALPRATHDDAHKPEAVNPSS